MPTIPKSDLVQSFSNGKKPDGQDFQNLIDSCYNPPPQPPVSNAGWYFFNFFAVSEPDLPFDIDLSSGIFLQNPENSSGIGRAFLNITVPRNVSQITKVRIIGNATVPDASGNSYLNLYLLKNDERNLIRPTASRTISFNRNINISYDEIIDKGISINPDTDALSIEINGRLSGGRSSGKISLKRVGLHFS